MSIPERLHRAVGGLPRTFWLLWVGTLINRLGGFVVPFLSLYLTRSRGVSVDQVGLVISVYGVGLVCAGPLGGLVADRVGRRPAMLLGLGAGGVSAIGLAGAETLAAITAWTFAFALLGETYRPGVAAMVADLVPTADRPRAFGLVYWAINLGFAVAVSVAGLFVDQGFALLFLIDGATSLAYAAIILVAVPETRPAGEPTTAGGGGLLAPLGDRDFLLFLAGTFALVVIFWQHQVALPVDITAHGISPAGYGRLIAINGVLIVLLQPFVAPWLGGLARAPVLAGACLLVGAGFGLNAVGGSAPLFALSIAVWTLGEIAYFPTASALVADLSPAAQRGRYQGLFSMTGGLAAAVAPAAGGALLHSAGRGAVWGACALLGALGAALLLRLDGPLRARLPAGTSAPR